MPLRTAALVTSQSAGSTTFLSTLICREYYLLIYAYEDFEELLVTAIVDTPPEYDNEVARGPGFTIQRMGRPN